MIIHCKYDIVFVQFFIILPIRFFFNKACDWSIGVLQIVNTSKLYHMLGSNHSTFYVWSFQMLFPYKFLVLKNANPSFYAKRVEIAYFPLPSKFEMFTYTLLDGPLALPLILNIWMLMITRMGVFIRCRYGSKTRTAASILVFYLSI
jgi:hypothetical protein